MFVTLFYTVIDAHNNLITYASAGHNDQMLVKAQTREVIMLNAEGKALGLADDENFEERVILYEPGDMLVLFQPFYVVLLLHLFYGEGRWGLSFFTR